MLSRVIKSYVGLLITHDRRTLWALLYYFDIHAVIDAVNNVTNQPIVFDAVHVTVGAE